MIISEIPSDTNNDLVGFLSSVLADTGLAIYSYFSLFCLKGSGKIGSKVQGSNREQRTAEPQNIQPQNFEGWNRYAQPFK